MMNMSEWYGVQQKSCRTLEDHTRILFKLILLKVLYCFSDGRHFLL